MEEAQEPLMTRTSSARKRQCVSGGWPSARSSPGPVLLCGLGERCTRRAGLVFVQPSPFTGHGTSSQLP